MKPFNLSNRINEYGYNDDGTPDSDILEVKDVKEFIRLLKETIKEGVERNNILPLDWCFDRIDELAGDDLI